MSLTKKMKIESASDFTSSLNESPGAIHSLPSEVLKNTFSYIGTGYFKLIGPVSKDFCYSYLTMDSVEDTYAHPMNRQLAIDRNKATRRYLILYRTCRILLSKCTRYISSKNPCKSSNQREKRHCGNGTCFGRKF